MPDSTATPEPTRPYIGGQAVLEGVMMRAPTSFAIVVRRRDGSLHVRERAMVDGRTGFAKLPFARGIASLVESCKLNGVNPHAWMTDTLTKLVNRWPAARTDELMPWAYPKAPPTAVNV